MSATVNSVGTSQNTQTQIQTKALTTPNNQGDIYTAMFAPSMANDYFGSQVFGTGSVYNTQASAPVSTPAAAQSTPVAAPEVEIPNIFESAPENYASALLQAHAIDTNPALQQLLEREIYQQNAVETAQTAPVQQQVSSQASTVPAQTTAAPTMQDYYIATQIANQFANSTPLVSPYDSYFQRDFFAQQSINPQTNVNNNQAANKISYAA